MMYDPQMRVTFPRNAHSQAPIYLLSVLFASVGIQGHWEEVTDKQANAWAHTNGKTGEFSVFDLPAVRLTAFTCS